MGLDYALHCRKCYEEWEEKDKLWEIKGQSPDEPEFSLENPIHIKSLIWWINTHRFHGPIDFVIEA